MTPLITNDAIVLGIIMFLGGTIGIVLGGPVAVLLVSVFSPELVGGQGPDAVWRGLSTVAGSWIGGLTSKFFWIVVIATTGGLLLSMSSRVRALEGVGASRLGSVLLYVLIATIGMKMDN